MPDKTCSKCGESFPLTSEYWPKRDTSKDGFRGQCLNCWREKSRNRMKEWRITNPEKAKAASRRAYWENPEKWRQQVHEWYEQNKEHVAEYNKRYREENPEIIQENIRRFHEENPDYRSNYYQEHKDEYRERARNWRAENLEQSRLLWHRYDARKKGAQGECTPSDAANIYRFQNGRCKYCNADLEATGKHLDHIIPLSRGGNNWPTNLQYLCPSCNTSKADKMPWEWKPSLWLPT